MLCSISCKLPSDIEKLERWTSYEPECFKERLDEPKYMERWLKDQRALLYISRYHEMINIFKSLSQEEDWKDDCYDYKLVREFEAVVDSIPRFDVKKFANYKLTEEEIKTCMELMRRCNKANSIEIMNEALDYPNPYLSDYMVDLLIHHPESDYVTSVKNINKGLPSRPRLILTPKKRRPSSEKKR